MFWIGFTNEPLLDSEPEEEGRTGLLNLGSHEERFVAHMWTWSRQQYVDHWNHALARAMDGGPAALVIGHASGIEPPGLVAHVEGW
jgi:hypothetical protein